MQEILNTVKTFVERELYPLEQTKKEKTWNQLLPHLEEKREQVKALGLWTPQIPKKWGGLGLTLMQFGKLSEWLGRSPYGHFVFNCQAPDAGNMEILMEYGTPSQQEKFLKPLLAGKIRSCFAMTEPEFAGSNPTLLGTTAVKEGDFYVLNGHKWFTSAADGAAFAIVMCITNPDEKNPYRRASQLLVPLNTPGFHFIRNIPVMGEAGEGYASHAELRFENCRIPTENLLAEEGAGFSIAQARLGPGRIHHCMRWIGICERAFDLMCRRAISREIDPGKTLASKQTIQHWIAEGRANIDAARLLVMDAAQKIDMEGAYAAKVEVSIIKFFCANVLQQMLDSAIQTHGALGITDDTPLAWWYRHERGARIYDGADEVHKSRIAKEILKKYL